MLEISEKLKREIFDLVISQSDPFMELGDPENIIKFLEKIWDLKSMPSEDTRFDDANGDIWQHKVNNEDWDYEYLFVERLKLLEDNVKFEKFIEILLSPGIRQNDDEITKYYLLFTPLLEKENFTLALESYDEDNFPIYVCKRLEDAQRIPQGLYENKILFYVVKSPKGYSRKIGSHDPPKVSPSIVLVHDVGWNDFSIKTQFSCFYYSAPDKVKFIGDIKIMQPDVLDTASTIPDEFYSLDNNFCSLGQEFDFYSNLKESFQKGFESIL